MAIEDVEFRHLRALQAVVEEGSFVGAADILGFSQAAISQQIAGLERAVGQSLFDRHGGPRPVTLTPAGRVLLEHADIITAQLEAAQDDLADLASGTAGRLRIGTYQSVSVQLLPDLVRLMRESAPDLAISLIEHDLNDELVEELLDGQIDVTFLAGPYHHDDLDIIDLGFDPFVVILPADGDLARTYRGHFFPTEVLADIPMVGNHQPTRGRDVIADGLRAHGVKARYLFRSNDNGATQGMVRAGMGPAVMPLLAIDTSDPGVVIRRLDPPLEPRTILVATPKGATPMPAAEAFVRIAKRECRIRLARSIR
jgi:DNA-binding transcriptional LysR family regulator